MTSNRLPSCDVCGEPCTEVHIDIRLPGPRSYSIRRDLCAKHWQVGQKAALRDSPESHRRSA